MSHTPPVDSKGSGKSRKQEILDKHWDEFIEFVKRYNREAMDEYKAIDSSNLDNYKDIEMGPAKIYTNDDCFWLWYTEIRE